MAKVVYIDRDVIRFNDRSELSSDHNQDCCEHHYLDFSNLTFSDFEGLDFDLSTPDFFERVPDYGIRLIPVNGFPVSVPGYGSNNGYYSHKLALVVELPNKTLRYDITECQEVNE